MCRCKKPSSTGKIFLLGLLVGGVYGMLFAKKAGTELRKELQQSKTPLADFLRAGAEMDLSFLGFLRKKIKTAIQKK